MNQVFYPGIYFPWKLKCCQLTTLASPSKKYLDGVAFDLEGSAFFNVTAKFVSIENIQLLKVVSDGAKSSYESITKKQVIELMMNCLTSLEDLIVATSENSLTDFSNIKETLNEMQSKWHISVSMKKKLENQLTAISVLKNHTVGQPPVWQSYKNLKKYLFDCEQWLMKIKPKLSE